MSHPYVHALGRVEVKRVPIHLRPRRRRPPPLDLELPLVQQQHEVLCGVFVHCGMVVWGAAMRMAGG